MKILIVSQFCEPEPTLKGVAFARSLMNLGHEVEILTGFPNYPGGEFYPGYQLEPYRLETRDGILVHRVPLFPSHDRSATGRSANYLSFAVAAALLGPLTLRKPDVIYAYHPPGTVGLVARWLSTYMRAPFVYDIQDMWPDTVSSSGMMRSRLVLGAIGVMCRITYRAAARVAVLSPGFKQLLVQRGVPENKIEVIYNWSDEATASETPRDPELERKLGLAGDCFRIVFAGTMGEGQALDTVIDAAAVLNELQSSIRFTFVGGGTARDTLRNKAQNMRLSNVSFIDRQPMSRIGPILASADALMVHLRSDPLYRITIPSKTQAYLAAGRPILMGVPGDAAHLVALAGAGVEFEPENRGSLVEAVLNLASMPAAEREAMGRNGRNFYNNKLCSSVGVSRFSRLFEEACQTGGRLAEGGGCKSI